MDRLSPNSLILDAGCGVGRFAVPLLERGHRLALIDVSAWALERAVKHCLRTGVGRRRFEAHLRDAHDLSLFPDGAFDATLAIELLCYQRSPTDLLAELVRVTRPGGWIAISVEGKHGALLYDPKIDLATAEAMLAGDAPLEVPGDVYVRHFSRDGLRHLIESSGLECQTVMGTHYLPDGVLHHLIDPARLGEPTYRRRLLNLEAACRRLPELASLARAWLAVGRRP